MFEHGGYTSYAMQGHNTIPVPAGNMGSTGQQLNFGQTSSSTPVQTVIPPAPQGVPVLVPVGSEDDDELTRPYKPAEVTFRSKFSRRIAEAPIKEKPNIPPTVGKYDGTSDPDDHINLFRSAGEVTLWPMPLWCKMFVRTLIGSARVWWDSLPIGGIDSFEELVTKFSQQFSQQMRHTKDRTEVLHIHYSILINIKKNKLLL
ncbi:putative retrotransposon gag domain-containing protein [Helianthus annuus]|nr:putative retrotransposon gag domain-containing protein [Helianthus annuus]KAJ0480148.1 putative retrotransposon gag domain-containing protein [Helianthus annuus]KAJ0496888.1 putative retrotransposon gag domain-containing protein [Helianthus annuus]KAJ0662919.1 putative retrotransposon gag domain-containing protein [Helianthus annuus]